MVKCVPCSWVWEQIVLVQVHMQKLIDLHLGTKSRPPKKKQQQQQQQQQQKGACMSRMWRSGRYISRSLTCRASRSTVAS
eukprot:1026104-Pelagomonas_calceolata.AAC.3